ncbi:hypothetical protein ACFO3O_12990 [Dokdonia ponticola]|uniref:Uncharacterized protein n=1 Tax=Dokdonia ponticola TaxID=2041041 RepID=A0ABV9HZQ2_9FLAO
MKKRKLSTLQILTIAFFVMCLIWERNIQLYLSEHGLENTLQTRKDLWVSLPILALGLFFSIRQWKRNKRQ